MRVGLRERALDSRRHEQRVVIVVDNHTNKGLCHRCYLYPLYPLRQYTHNLGWITHSDDK